jgi:hypothetical protein
MNSDEIISLIVKLIVAMLSTWFGAAIASDQQTTAIATGIGAAITIGVGIYNHWNMKKVPETATVVGGSK